MGGKRKRTPKRKATTSLQPSASKQRTNKESRNLSESTTSNGEGSSRRKQKNPARKRAYTDMVMYGKRFKVSMKMVKEIRNLQSSTKMVIPRTPFARVIREILAQYGQDIRVQRETLEALQQATEIYMHQFFEDSNICAMHAKRVTLFPKDMQLVNSLRINNST